MSETKQVPPEFRTRLVAAVAKIGSLKQQIGDEQLRHERQKVALFAEANAAGKAAEGIARDAALRMGIDPSTPGVSFDWATLEFKLDMPKAPAPVPRRHGMSQTASALKGKRR